MEPSPERDALIHQRALARALRRATQRQREAVRRNREAMLESWRRMRRRRPAS
jgi:hypothetical protein